MVDVVILAGGVETGPLAAETRAGYRSLIEIGGRPIIRRLLAAMRGASELGNVALVAPSEVQSAVGDEAVDFRVAPGADLLENIKRGLAALPEREWVVLSSADLPLLTSEAIDDFVRAGLASRAEFAYPIIPRETSERRFPGGRRTYVRLKEGQFTGGNLVLISRSFLEQHQEVVSRLYQWRKNPLRLASLFGPSLLLKLVLGRAALADIEARASQIFRGRVSAIVTTYPEVGFDVDKTEDLQLAREVARADGGGEPS